MGRNGFWSFGLLSFTLAIFNRIYVYICVCIGHGRAAAVALAWMIHECSDKNPQDLNTLLGAKRKVRKNLYSQNNIVEFANSLKRDRPSADIGNRRFHRLGRAGLSGKRYHLSD